MKLTKNIIKKLLIRSFLFTGVMGTMTPLQASEECPDPQETKIQVWSEVAEKSEELTSLINNGLINTLQSLQKAKKLIEEGANIFGDPVGNTPPSLSPFTLQNIPSSLFPYLLQRQYTQVNTPINGKTALHWAVIHDRPDFVRALLKNSKTDINVQDKNGDTPLHLAVASNNLLIVKLLLMSGADVNILNTLNITVLDLVKPDTAVILPTIIMLVNTQIKRQQRTQKLFTLIANNGSLSACEELIKKGININTRMEFSETLLLKTASMGDPEIIKLLLHQEGIDIDAMGQVDGTSLYWAIFKWSCDTEHYNFAIIKALIKNGAALNEPIYSGFMPLEAAFMAIWNRAFSQEPLKNVLVKIEYLIEVGACISKSFYNRFCNPETLWFISLSPDQQWAMNWCLDLIMRQNAIYIDD
ncbi:MAG: ankyrin repeat domain-containing protein [Puniceicoccales bacterium]|jgi:ankyrin repeat protein|nr:ankyrin repeat domain-containing protein [Puniceicoccales bacterium]